MNEKQLNLAMSDMLSAYNDKKIDIKTLIAKAVQLGMDYRESMIKKGIEIVFNTIHDKHIKK